MFLIPITIMLIALKYKQQIDFLKYLMHKLFIWTPFKMINTQHGTVELQWLEH